AMTASIAIVADSEPQVDEAQVRLARVGLENVKGYLAGGMNAWQEAGLELAIVPQISVTELRGLIETRPDLQLVDVRRPAEYQSGHAPRAISAQLATLREKLSGLNLRPMEPVAVICAGGFGSSAATGLMEQAGFTNLLNVTVGHKAWVGVGYDVEVPR